MRIEHLMGSMTRYTRNVKRWRAGSMIVRWVGAALQHAQAAFRRVRGFKEIPTLLRALAQANPVDIDQATA